MTIFIIASNSLLKHCILADILLTLGYVQRALQKELLTAL